MYTGASRPPRCSPSALCLPRRRHATPTWGWLRLVAAAIPPSAGRRRARADRRALSPRRSCASGFSRRASRKMPPASRRRERPPRSGRRNASRRPRPCGEHPPRSARLEVRDLRASSHARRASRSRGALADASGERAPSPCSSPPPRSSEPASKSASPAPSAPSRPTSRQTRTVVLRTGSPRRFPRASSTRDAAPVLVVTICRLRRRGGATALLILGV